MAKIVQLCVIQMVHHVQRVKLNVQDKLIQTTAHYLQFVWKHYLTTMAMTALLHNFVLLNVMMARKLVLEVYFQMVVLEMTNASQSLLQLVVTILALVLLLPKIVLVALMKPLNVH